MIPNTDINCGKCAAPIYSDCVMWSGGNLPCVTLLQDCCDTSLTKVVELLGNYVCNLTNIANYNIPVCMESYSITDFVGMQNAMMELICQQQASIDLTGLNWGCMTSGATSSVEDSMQAVIDEVNDQQISYNTATDFTITGEGCNQVLNLQQDHWIPFQPVDIQGNPRPSVYQDNGWELVDGGNKISPAYNGTPSMWYRKDSLGNVSIVGVFGVSGITSAWVRTITGGSPTTNNVVKLTGIVDQNTDIHDSSATVSYAAGTWIASDSTTGTIEWSKDLGSTANTAIKFIYIPRTINGIDITPYIGTDIRAITTFCWGYNLNPKYYHSVSGSNPPNNAVDSRAHVVIPCTLSKNDTAFSQNVLKLAMLPKWDEQVPVGMSIYLRIDYNVNN